MASSLTNLAVNVTEGIHKIKFKDSNCSLEYYSIKDDLIEFKCLPCNKDYSGKVDEELKKKFKNTFKFSNIHINEFVFLLRKSVYPYEYMDA